MSEATTELPARKTRSNAAAANGEAKTTRPRAPSKPKPIFFVLQVTDDNGNAMPINKKNVKVLAVERDSDTVLELIDGGQYENAFYLRSMLAPGR